MLTVTGSALRGIGFYTGLNAINFARLDAPFGLLQPGRLAEMYLTLALQCHFSLPRWSRPLMVSVHSNPGYSTFDDLVCPSPPSLHTLPTSLLPLPYIPPPPPYTHQWYYFHCSRGSGLSLPYKWMITPQGRTFLMGTSWALEVTGASRLYHGVAG